MTPVGVNSVDLESVDIESMTRINEAQRQQPVYMLEAEFIKVIRRFLLE